MHRFILAALIGIWPVAMQAQSTSQSSALEIDVPDLVIVGKPEPKALVINVPDMLIVGRPEPAELVINVPDMTIVGRPQAVDLVVNVPDLMIVGKPAPKQLEIDVPNLVIVGRPDCDNAVGGRDCDTLEQGGIPEGSTTASPQPVERKLWCNGPYSAHFSSGLASSQGVAMPVGQFDSAPAQVDTKNCGARMTVTIGGLPVTMEFDEELEHYSGVLGGMGDGVNRLLFLTCDEDFQMRGQLVAQDPDLQITRAVWLIRKDDPKEITCD